MKRQIFVEATTAMQSLGHASPSPNLDSVITALQCSRLDAVEFALRNFNDDKNEYVVCFGVTPNHRVVLVEKNRPEWQRGKLNGLGGKIEAGEGWIECARREFRDEAGVDFSAWALRGVIEGFNYRVYVMYAMSDAFYVAKTMTDEKVGLYPTGFILNSGANTLSNIPALLQLVLPPQPPSDTLTPPFFTLRYA